MGANTLVRTSSGARVPEELAEMNLAVERIMRWGEGSMTVTQGSRSVSVGASGNTHGGDDAEDLTSNEAAAKEKYMRLQGGMFYVREYIRNLWPKHVHGGRDWSKVGSPAYSAQIVSYHRRENALANRGRDTGYHMLVFPKHIYKGYIGYVQARGATNAYEQPTGKSKKLTPIKRKQITYVVAEMEVAGSRWYLTLTGKCIKASRFNKIKRPAGATPTKPDVQPKPQPVVAKPAPVAPKPAPAPAPAPAPVHSAAPRSVTLKMGTRNVIYRRVTESGILKGYTNVKKGLPWSKRKTMIATDAAKSGIVFLGTQEAGTYASGEELEKAIERATGENWENILHGDDRGDITQGNLWQTDTLKRLDSGKVHTEGTDHDWAVWTKCEVVANGDIVWFVNLHEEWREGGKSSKGNIYDKKRERQFREAVAEVEELAGPDALIIFVGDFNSHLKQPYDGPGRAAASLGYVDAEKVAADKVNLDKDSYHGFESPTPADGKQFDRFFVKKKHIESGRISINRLKLESNSSTKQGADHYQATLTITINKK